MKTPSIRTAIVATTLLLTVAACSGSDESADDEGGDVSGIVTDLPAFADGSRMAQLSESGAVTIGVTVDKPGYGVQEGSGAPTGFDPAIGTIIATKLGVDPEAIEWLPTAADDREGLLQSGTADFVIAEYPITPENRAVVGLAGPYLTTDEGAFGIGFSNDYPELCQFVTDTLAESIEDGSWADAFDDTLGAAGETRPEAPTLDPC